MQPIIKIENLSKQYRLGVVGTGTLSNDLKRWWHRMRGKEDPFLKVGETNERSVKGASQYVWALRDINLEVMPGEVLGIIGKNGAGKSTLLKILSKVTGPTTGSIYYNGRIGSLLEVGTGFHPELTGRENIFLNGAILGMTKAEIRSKLDEIIDFSGVARYIDTPVKRYSSGMMVRLGFAVAAHLEPEILVVDEVLAVGDAEFQKKAIGKMQDVSKNQGRTVLFVSHNMAAVKSLCSRGIVLVDGLISKTGETDDVVTEYLKGSSDITNHKVFNNNEVAKDNFVLTEIGIKARNKDYTEQMRVDEDLVFSAKYLVNEKYDSLHLTLHVKDDQGNKIFSTNWGKSGVSYEHDIGYHLAEAVIPANFFNWGTYFIDLYVIKDRKNALLVDNDIISFTLGNKEIQLGAWMGREPGSITPVFQWQKVKL